MDLPVTVADSVNPIIRDLGTVNLDLQSAVAYARSLQSEVPTYAS
jgi:hypothetical protein